MRGDQAIDAALHQGDRHLLADGGIKDVLADEDELFFAQMLAEFGKAILEKKRDVFAEAVMLFGAPDHHDVIAIV